jgi:hypothetical protein
MAPGTAARLLVVVHLSSERMLEPARGDGSFPEKQESGPARLLVVRGERRQRAAQVDCSSTNAGVSAEWSSRRRRCRTAQAN